MGKKRKVYKGHRDLSGVPGKRFVGRPKTDRSSANRFRQKIKDFGLTVSGEPEGHNHQFPRRGLGVPWTIAPH